MWCLQSNNISPSPPTPFLSLHSLVSPFPVGTASPSMHYHQANSVPSRLTSCLSLCSIFTSYTCSSHILPQYVHPHTHAQRERETHALTHTHTKQYSSKLTPTQQQPNNGPLPSHDCHPAVDPLLPKRMQEHRAPLRQPQLQCLARNMASRALAGKH
jgi:hypothetical protein